MSAASNAKIATFIEKVVTKRHPPLAGSVEVEFDRRRAFDFHAKAGPAGVRVEVGTGPEEDRFPEVLSRLVDVTANLYHGKVIGDGLITDEIRRVRV